VRRAVAHSPTLGTNEFGQTGWLSALNHLEAGVVHFELMDTGGIDREEVDAEADRSERPDLMVDVWGDPL
jgi:hypothetical protein